MRFINYLQQFINQIFAYTLCELLLEHENAITIPLRFAIKHRRAGPGKRKAYFRRWQPCGLRHRDVVKNYR